METMSVSSKKRGSVNLGYLDSSNKRLSLRRGSSVKFDL